jgi:ABC-type multidrug transport system fused ATPase/permease subunit
MTQQTRAVLAFALAQLRPESRLLAVATFWRVLFRLLPVQAPLLAGALIDGLQGNAASVWGWQLPVAQPLEVVQVIGIVLVGISLATGAAAFLSERASRELQTRCVNRLRQQVQRVWAYAPVTLHRRHGASLLSDWTLSETRSIGRFARGTVAEGVAALARLAYPAVVLIWIDPWMAMLPIAATPLHLGLTWMLQRRRSHLQRNFRSHRHSWQRAIRESLQGIDRLQGAGLQAGMLAHLDRYASRCQTDVRSGSLYHSLALGSAWALPALSVALSWWIGGGRVVAGDISSGQLVAFVGFAAYLGVPMRRFAQQVDKARQSLKCLARIQSLLRHDVADSTGSLELQAKSGALTVFNLGYQFHSAPLGDKAHGGEPKQAPLFQNFNLTIPARSLVWLHGERGSGKSVLLRLMAGLEPPSSGSVLLDGHDLARCTRQSVRQRIALAPQHPCFLSGSIASNLRLAAPSATEEDLMTACAQVGLASFIDALPKQLRTPLGERGVRLSAGEAQRLGIARALLLKPSVLLLDEPFAALDVATARQLLQALLRLSAETTIVVASRDVPAHPGIRHVVHLDGATAGVTHHQFQPAQAAVLAHMEP